jgi:hypothetical protein
LAHAVCLLTAATLHAELARVMRGAFATQLRA